MIFNDVEIGEMFVSEGQNFVKCDETSARPILMRMLGSPVTFFSGDEIDSRECPELPSALVRSFWRHR